MQEPQGLVPTAQNLAHANGLDHEEEGVTVFERPNNLAIRAEVDMQITTAKQYPRSIKGFKDEALAMATLDEETASGCMFALPRAGKTIEGPSVRLAEIVASAWGNLRTEARVVGCDEKEIIAEATTWDLEKNVAMRIQSRRRITDKYGKRFKDDMITVTGNAAISIALRNSVFRVVPKAYINAIYRAARQVAIGDASTLATRRANAVESFGKMGVTPEQIFTRLGKASIEDIGLDDLALLKGFYTAIRDGETTVDEVFAVPATDAPVAGVAGLKDRITQKPAEPTAETAPAADTAPATEPATEPEPSTEAEAPATDPEPVAENPTSDEAEKDAQPAADEPAEADDLSKLRANVQAAMDALDNKVRKDLLVGKPGIGQMGVDELNQLLIDIRKAQE